MGTNSTSTANRAVARSIRGVRVDRARLVLHAMPQMRREDRSAFADGRERWLRDPTIDFALPAVLGDKEGEGRQPGV